MAGFASARASIAATQRTYRSGRLSALQARALIANITPGDSILRHTIPAEPGLGIHFAQNDNKTYILIESDHLYGAGCYYAFRQLPNGTWFCSDKDERIVAKYLPRIQAWLASSAVSA